MATNNGPLKESDRRKINDNLKTLVEILEETKQAKEAGVPRAEDIERTCQDCINRYKLLKQTYFPNKP